MQNDPAWAERHNLKVLFAVKDNLERQLRETNAEIQKQGALLSKKLGYGVTLRTETLRQEAQK